MGRGMGGVTYVEASTVPIAVRNQNSLMGSADTKPPRRTTVDHVSARKPEPVTSIPTIAWAMTTSLMSKSSCRLHGESLRRPSGCSALMLPVIYSLLLKTTQISPRKAGRSYIYLYGCTHQVGTLYV
uniref:Uncharacterized protein n=1 Tax=Oryza brachyantha TaxID=4533 RepID=J3M568_ORYBR